MMNNEKLNNLIDKLNDKTVAKQANWTKSSGDQEFKISLKTGPLTIQKFRDYSYQNQMVIVSIYNLDGNLIENYEIQEGMSGYDSANELFLNVKRVFYKVEETVDSILDQLDSDDILGEEEQDLPF